ncbi:MAG: putative glycolipid-binding domain-containing protein [Hyphomonadaceae bacterium]|nr:putative glycolipid-binding domain-containing protein [Hyphomonadaceae bacterium]
MFRRWRRIDQPGLELARIDIGNRSATVSSTVIDAGEPAFSLRYVWTLDGKWRTKSLRIEQVDHIDRWLTVERTGNSEWRIDGRPAPHLDGCPELDLSATPFCNGLAIRRLGEDGEFTAAYIDASDLSVTPSRQRYEQLGPSTWRYIDLGVAKGFTAKLELDEDGFVATYEGLFEALN